MSSKTIQSIQSEFLDWNQFQNDLYQRHRNSEKFKHRDYHAARKIQTIYRGFICRKKIQFQHKMATIIQKNFRGFIGRKQYYQILEESLQNKLVSYYNNMAKIIQKIYRGYKSRLRIFDYYKMKEWIKLIIEKNIKLSENTNCYMHKERVIKMKEENIAAKKLCCYIGIKLHHLLRTTQITGIYSLKHSNALSQVEELLNCFHFKNYNTDLRNYFKEQHNKYMKAVDKLYDHTDQQQKNRYDRCEKFWRHKNLDLIELEMMPKEKLITGTKFKQGQIIYPYKKSMFATEKYCTKILDFTRDFDILEPGKDFSLNTRITQKPDNIEKFVAVLTNFCELHHIIEK